MLTHPMTMYSINQPPTDYRCGIDNVAKEWFDPVLHAGDVACNLFNVRISEYMYHFWEVKLMVKC